MGLNRLIAATVIILAMLTALGEAQINGWFPRISPNAEHVVSGAGELWLDSAPLMENGRPVIGWNPAWLSDTAIVYNGGPGVGLRKFNLVTFESVDVDPRELIELAAGAEQWAGRHAPSNALIVGDGREIPGGGQPSFAPDGALIYRVGDDKIEPSISNTAEAWGNGRGRIFGGLRGGTIADRTVGEFEARPVLVDTPEGPFVLAMTRTSFHLRPLFSDRGYMPPASIVGDNRNLNADARYVNGRIVAVWQDDRGQLFHWSQPLDAPRTPLGLSPSEPPIVNPPQDALPDPAVARKIVERERAKFGPMSAEQVAEFLKNVARALNAKPVAGGPFGVLIKTTGSQCAGYSCDIICVGNGAAQKQWDVLSDADPGGAQRPTWSGPLEQIAVRECEIPAGGVVEPEPEPEPQPEPDTELTARIKILEAQVLALQGEVADSRTQQGVAEQERDRARAERDELQRKLDAILAQPTPRCTASIFGIKIPCKVIR